ncbi:cellulase family glycosylhydrolase [Mucilaginibacter sp.]|uniref:cellulase family glycosylhydrolase n=1 Tax=Mucilaginibacter sp. TaxID=1882438 RepID=UPI002ED563F7
MKHFISSYLLLFLAICLSFTACKKGITNPGKATAANGTNNLQDHAFTASSFLKVSGKVLKDNSGTGSVVNLRGTNLGSWLSQEAWIGPLGTGALNRLGWTATASGTMTGTTTSAIFDNDLNTRWSTGIAQAPGQWLKIDMGSLRVFDQIGIDAGNFTTDYLRQYLVQTSADGVNWTNVGSGTGAKFVSVNFGATQARYILIYQQGTASDAYWSVAEVNAYMNDDTSLRNTFITRFGQPAADNLLDTFQNVWITTSDLDKIKDMGMNMVRVPVYWRELMDDIGVMKSNAFTQLDWLSTQCTSRNLYIIIDLHGAPGGSDGYITSGEAVNNNLWTTPAYQTMTVNIWKAIATHFNGNPAIAAYDLLNEPVTSSSALSIKAFYNTLYTAIRAIDADHIICMQAFYNFDTLGSPTSNGWTNVLYQAHYYDTNTTNYAEQSGFIDNNLADMDSHRQMWNVPVYAGEYNYWLFLDLWGKWMKGLNSHNMSWSNWTYKNMTTGNNWGFYQGNTNAVPDMNNDASATITSKWSKFATSFFTVNQPLVDTVKKYTTVAAAPLD